MQERKFCNTPAITLKDQIARHFASLSPQLRLAARYVSAHPEDVATRSLRQVASRSGLTPPTYSRLARAIGFAQYEGLRDSCRKELRQSRLSLAERAALLQKPDENNPKEGRGSFAAIHAHSAVSGIQRLLDEMDVGQLAEAADQLVAAKNVYLIGSLCGRTMVEYLAYMTQMVTPNWRVVGQGASSASGILTGASENDALIAIAAAPYASETVKAVQLVADSGTGANIIVITDDLLSPLLKHASYSFLIPAESSHFFPSHVALVTFLEILTGMIVRRLGEEGQNRINAVEQSSHAIGDYWQQ